MSALGAVISQYRDSHHRIAQMVAMGCTPSMIRRQTGVSQRRLSLLLADPTFNELIAQYAKRQEAAIELAADSYAESAISNMLRAEAQIADHLDASEETGELLPVAILDKISQGRADRFGYSKHSTVQVKHDFASLLDKAIARSGKVIEMKTVEGQLEAAGAAPANSVNRAIESSLDVSAGPRPIEGTATESSQPIPATVPSLAVEGPVMCGETPRPVPRSFAQVLARRRRLG